MPYGAAFTIYLNIGIEGCGFYKYSDTQNEQGRILSIF